MSTDLHNERREYSTLALSRDDLNSDPHTQFAIWMDDARAANIIDATAMTLSTVSADGQPHARIVLLKDHNPEGFSFFTDTCSHKGQQLAQNPKACLLFYWQHFERQIRITGTTTRIDSEVAEAYFHSRPMTSQISAAVSQQSSIVDNRETLQTKVAVFQQEHSDSNVVMPRQWGGYLLQATTFEFWQGRDSRLHDRFHYSRSADVNSESAWRIDRLQP